MNELALFAGGGGGVLAGKMLGWRTVCAVELDDYARRVLIARQDDGSLDPFPINPTWVEWLMGWPLGWTVCSASATGRSRSARPKRGGNSSPAEDGDD